jgi:actin-like ATPase involved in cell morphogenesis/energy-coupling factor transporter ATP-binding protein EcfA2
VIDRLIHSLAMSSDITAEEMLDVLWLSAIHSSTQVTGQAAARSQADASAPGHSPEQPTGGAPRSSSPAQTQAGQAGDEVPLRLGGARTRNGADDGEPMPATEVGFAAPRPIRDALAMPRALRRLRQVRIPSRHLAVDINATVEATAEADGRLVPVFTRPLERGLDLVLLADGSASMRVWDSTFEELEQLLIQTGAFRSVSRLRLVVRDRAVVIEDPSGTLHPPRRIVDPSGKRAILVATDASAESWYTREPWDAIASWCQAMPVALIQVLPQNYWARTALGAPYVTTRALRPASPNSEYARRLAWWAQDPGGPALPVMTLTPEALETWAQAAVSGTAWATGITATPPDPEYAPSVAFAEADAETLVNDFLSRASPSAERLARVLASAPALSMALITVLQESLAPETGILELAEILSSSLLENISGSAGEQLFRFRHGAREILQRGVTTFEEWDTFEAISAYLDRRAGTGSDIHALLADPQGTAKIDAEMEPFAALRHSVAAQLGLAIPSDAAFGSNPRTQSPVPVNVGGLPNSALSSQLLTAVDHAIEQLPEGGPLAAAHQTLQAMRASYSSPLRVALVGRVGSGKSTLVNALLGESILPISAGAFTHTITRLGYAPRPEITAVYKDGARTHPTTLSELTKPNLFTDSSDLGTLEYLALGIPSPYLRTFDLIDTPGLGSDADSVDTMRFIGLGETEIGIASLKPEVAADALIMVLSRGMTGADELTLTALNLATPVAAIGALTKIEHYWDRDHPEVMVTGRQIADRLLRENRLRQALYDLHPVASLVGAAAGTFTEEDFADLTELAMTVDPSALAEQVSFAPRFAAADNVLAVPSLRRRSLYERFSAYGLVLACSLIRDGIGDPAALRAELLNRSGVAAFRKLLADHFGSRTNIIKLWRIVSQTHTLVTAPDAVALPARARAALTRATAEITGLASQVSGHDAALSHAGMSDVNTPILVIDFGTTYTKAVLIANETYTIRDPLNGALMWPSAVYRDGETMLVGAAAEARRRFSPANYAAGFKRDLGRDVPVIVGGKAFKSTELVTCLLAAQRTEAESIFGRRVTRAILTVPSFYPPARRQLMVDAGEMTGFDIVKLLDEAAAAALMLQGDARYTPGDLVLLCDFGGGAFHAALVLIGSADHLEILGIAGLADCGGDDIDALLLRYLLENRPDLQRLISQNTRQTSAPEPANSNASTRLYLKELSTSLKHLLSTNSSASELLGPDPMTEILLTRSELETVAEPVIARTVTCCKDLLAGSDVPPEDLAGILLVGGGSRMPLVPAILSREFGRPINQSNDPELAVVLGAARFTKHAESALTWRADRRGAREEPAS